MSTQDVPAHILAEATRQHALLVRGVAAVYPEKGAYESDGLFDKLVQALQEDRPLKIKLGCDPTAPDIHLGHTVILNLLRRFQDLGHKVQFLIGDYTTLIGDPSGRNDTRPPLTPAEIDEYAQTYFEQVHKVLDEYPARLEILKNSDWLSKLDFADTIKLCAQVTVAQIIQREDFANRLANNTPISMHELLYPIMQGYDSVCMGCDIEVGGTDQTFNCLMGRQLMQAKGMTPQVVMTMPLLVGLDGQMKMSKSKHNYVAIMDDAADMFGKIMSIPDSLLSNYFELLTDMQPDAIPEHPMAAKKQLGHTITARFHGEAAADKAQHDFEARFSKKEVPDELPEHPLAHHAANPVKLLQEVGFAASASEARRLIQQGSVKLDGHAVTDIHEDIAPDLPAVLQVGRRRMVRLT